MEGLQQDNARSNAALQSLREQLTQMEKERSPDHSTAELHTEIGRLKTSMNDKVTKTSTHYLLCVLLANSFFTVGKKTCSEGWFNSLLNIID